MNRVLLIGRLGRDPEVKALPSGRSVANFSLATDEPVKKPDGSWERRAEWHKLVAWGTTAETVGKYFRKGSWMAVEGRLQTREWEKDGAKRYSTEVVIDRLEFVGPKQNANPSAATPGPGAATSGPADYPETDEPPF